MSERLSTMFVERFGGSLDDRLKGGWFRGW